MENDKTNEKIFIEETFKKLCNEFSNCLKCHKDYTFHPINKSLRIAVIQNNIENYKHVGIVASKIGPEYKLYPQAIQDCITGLSKSLLIIAKKHYEDFEKFSSNEIVFTSQVYLYTDKLLVPEDEIRKYFQENKLKLLIRDDKYWVKFFKRKKPDVFICHDARDKEVFVRLLYNALTKRLIKVWYDEFSLKIGDSLVNMIDEGLKSCKYGIVIISKNFLNRKKWTNREWRSLVTREIDEEKNIILPIWLGVSKDEVAKYSLDLADKYALNASEGIDVIADKITGIVKK